MTPHRLALAGVVYLAVFGTAYVWIRSVTPAGGWPEVVVIVLTLLVNAVTLGGLLIRDERKRRAARISNEEEAPGSKLAGRPLPLFAGALAAFLPLPILRFALDDFSVSGLARGAVMTLAALLAALIGVAIIRYGYRDLL